MFTSLTLLPQDAIYGMQALYKNDARDDKINVSIGICLDEESHLLRFKALDVAEKKVFQKKPSKEYLPITGHPAFCEMGQKLILDQFPADLFFSTQTVGGTGALFIASKLLVRANITEIFIPEPSWPNHKQLFQEAGLRVKSYPYLNKSTMSLDFDSMLESISYMPEGSIIVLQASCHNPTGVDPTKEQWQAISSLVKKKQLIPLFDLAYLGFGNGVQDDLQAIHTFVQDDHDLFIATTFAKSMGLYNDRLGLLSIKCRTNLDVIASHIRAIIRTCYSSPPALGALLANEILADDELKTTWLDELEQERLRLVSNRQSLYDALKAHNCKITYEHLLSTKGLFCLFNLTQEQVTTLRKRDGIYLSLDGRLSVGAITSSNIHRLAKSLSTI